MIAHPSVEVVLSHDVDDEVHVGVLKSAELRALTPEGADLLGSEPEHLGLARNHVELACQLRDPEAVIRVRGKECKECRGWMRGVAHRNMKLIGSHDLQARIAILPPKLMTNSHYLK